MALEEMNMTLAKSIPALPPTVNLHILGHCNYRCGFCYAPFTADRVRLPLEAAQLIIGELARRGVQRVTFAGGEPTLHPDLVPMLQCAAAHGLVTSVVSNGSLLDRHQLRRILPWLRWLVLSCDSHRADTCEALGRGPARFGGTPQPDLVRRICDDVHAWNAARAEADKVRLKLNLVVTALNAGEDPSEWIRSCAPDRVKLLQCLLMPGENDGAVHLVCTPNAFRRYAERVGRLDSPALRVVAESVDDIVDSYAMIDPRGRFRQGTLQGYLRSDPILEVGVDAAWQQVGGCDLERFEARGGRYDHGVPSRGIMTPVVAVEGLDGSGKSTTVRALAERLGAVVVRCPPESWAHERGRYDALPPAERRAWYRRANDAAMREATEHVFAGRAVVMDRCFASTEAYAAAEQGRVATAADMPPPTQRPDLIVFLDLAEPVRRARLAGRALAQTAEELRLENDDAFREAVRAGYLQLGAVAVDASGPTAEVVAGIRALCFGDACCGVR